MLSWARLLMRKKKQLDPLEHFCLLRSCVVPRFNYYVRTHDTECVKEAAEAFDLAILRSVLSLAERDDSEILSDEQLSMIRIPLRHGGLGIRSLAEIAPVAYASSTGASRLKQKTATAQIDARPMEEVETGSLAELRSVNARRGA